MNEHVLKHITCSCKSKIEAKNIKKQIISIAKITDAK